MRHIALMTTRCDIAMLVANNQNLHNLKTRLPARIWPYLLCLSDKRDRIRKKKTSTLKSLENVTDLIKAKFFKDEYVFAKIILFAQASKKKIVL